MGGFVEIQLWQQLGISLGLGLLVGLQREWSEPGVAGIRTFAVITVFGTVCAHLAGLFGGWVLSGGLVALGAMMVVTNLKRVSTQDVHAGPTTEIAALLMFGVGALLGVGNTPEAIAIGGGTAVLLQWKRLLHGFVERIGQAEIRAVFRLVLIALVILPILPDRSFGPYAVLNPFQIWLVVVLIVGISVCSYLLSRYLSGRAGSVVGGLLGGLVSSTATAVSFARRSKQVPASSPLAALVVMIASAVVYLRVFVEVVLVAPAIALQVLPQLGVMCLWMTLIVAGYYLSVRHVEGAASEPEDPSALTAAVFFGALYALVLLAVAAAREYLGDHGLFYVAALSGLTDMDAITLSTAQMVSAGSIAVDTGWRMMLIGSLSNILFKGVVIAVLGPRQLLARIALLFGLSLAGGMLILWLWPAVGS